MAFFLLGYPVPLKQYTTELRIHVSLETLEQCSSTLAPEMFITKETKCHPLCDCHDNGQWFDNVVMTTVLSDVHSWCHV